LDIVWINDNKIVGLAENLPPATLAALKFYSPPEPVSVVLEINAGDTKKWGLYKGQEVFIYENGQLVLY
jgi:uncharacterized membrane protein (UPF0127 family)